LQVNAALATETCNLPTCNPPRYLCLIAALRTPGLELGATVDQENLVVCNVANLSAGDELTIYEESIPGQGLDLPQHLIVGRKHTHPWSHFAMLFWQNHLLSPPCAGRQFAPALRSMSGTILATG
jgi:hypothetical protein